MLTNVNLDCLDLYSLMRLKYFSLGKKKLLSPSFSTDQLLPAK